MPRQHGFFVRVSKIFLFTVCSIPTSSSKKKQSLKLNHKPQVSPQHRHHHDKVRKNGISYAVGLMRSITYPQICLVNRKTAMAFKPSTNVGFASNREDQSYVTIDFLANPYGRVKIRPRIIWYSTCYLSTIFCPSSFFFKHRQTVSCLRHFLFLLLSCLNFILNYVFLSYFGLFEPAFFLLWVSLNWIFLVLRPFWFCGISLLG